MPTYWMSTNRMTVGVTTNAEGVIVATPPIVAKFRWQHIDALRAWLVRQGGYKEFELEEAAS
jgi:hypothetical protein